MKRVDEIIAATLKAFLSFFGFGHISGELIKDEEAERRIVRARQ